MFTELQQEYQRLSDDELLHLAHARSSLTDEAKVALDAEMRSRNLSADDIQKHARFVRKSEWRETRRRKSLKLFGTRISEKSGREILVAFFWIAVTISVILLGYFALPARYRLPADWQEAAGYTMFSTVFLAAWFFSYWGRRLGFWVSLLISSTAQALVLHAWIVRIGTDMIWRGRAGGKGAMFLGVILFLFVYGCGALLRRKFYAAQTNPNVS
jgi:hypothetical protein